MFEIFFFREREKAFKKKYLLVPNKKQWTRFCDIKMLNNNIISCNCIYIYISKQKNYIFVFPTHTHTHKREKKKEKISRENILLLLLLLVYCIYLSNYFPFFLTHNTRNYNERTTFNRVKQMIWSNSSSFSLSTTTTTTTTKDDVFCIISFVAFLYIFFCCNRERERTNEWKN